MQKVSKNLRSIVLVFFLITNLSLAFGQDYDFGDAPDPTYPTLLASNGARHIINPDVFLGSIIDDEKDGAPNATATGDDVSLNDDEDGVTFTSDIIPGETATVSVVASTNGILYGWIDFNQNGDWGDGGDVIFSHQAIVAGTNSLSFSVPAGATVGASFARFRFSINGIDSYEGEAPDGEVEDYMVTITPEMVRDYGDAPDDKYQTLKASDGASHYVDHEVYLGGSVDTDADGQPTTLANGDDTDGSDDEDGVTFPNLYAGQTFELQVTASTQGILYSWMDFNQDNDWDDAGEMVITNMVISGGLNTILIDIPADAQLGNTYARFRFSSKGTDSYYGEAGNGEVEDYRIEIKEEVSDIDFGDAPYDRDIYRYPTLLANDGARHIINEKVYLGDKIDPEPDGQPTSGADGDDKNDTDDEDGVTFNSHIIPGKVVELTVNASTFGYLNAWMDFNGDGDWEDNGEMIFNSEAINMGNNNLTFSVPEDAKLGYTYTRFRFGLESYGKFSGEAPDGEVEDYKVEIVNISIDFGDAPFDKELYHYPTKLSEDGARHIIDEKIYLGKKIDSESDGQPTVDSDGDDNNNLNDEDGVSFTSTIIPGSESEVIVTASTDGFLNAWMDFNADGDWEDNGEFILQDKNLVSGDNTLNFSVPEDAKIGDTYTRFRFGTKSYDKFTREAPDGEVEDYKVTVEEEVELDFGDAPDDPTHTPAYPTLLVNDGARHKLSNLYLGSKIDAESDGQETGNADGDDNDGNDDEDGVVPQTSFVTGQSVGIVVTSTGAGYIDAWMDWNQDGDWDDNGEQIFNTYAVVGGNNNLTINVPANAVLGTTYARYRLSSRGDYQYTGSADDGEVEDYKITIHEPELDFGDAPDDPTHAPAYPTLLANDGARHKLSNLYLGSKVDAESDGQETDNADGDDNDGNDDEDGVVPQASFITGQSVNVVVTSTGSGYLDAWMDWNQDGDWDDNGEQIFNTYTVASGNNNLTINVPANAVLGTTYARYRLSSRGDYQYTGSADDGEVEDYIYTIAEEALYDFGDAPDENYKTLLASNGARHKLDEDYYLGSHIDTEADGQPSSSAFNDDYYGTNDDEDGITFNDLFIIGNQVNIAIQVSNPGKLDAWIDWEGDGDWIDGIDRIANNTNLVSGNNLLTITVPEDAIVGETYTRFRYSQNGVASYTGEAPEGEVEDYKIEILKDMDYGDLPDSYSTLFASNGARHIYNPDVFLGSEIDIEEDGIPTVGADGDDKDNQADEDGVTFIDPIIPGDTVSIKVHASTNGVLNAWMDFNNNGDFSDNVNEHIFINKAIVAGDNIIWFAVPADAYLVKAYSRFRFSLNGNDDIDGSSPDGEVEDYRVQIESEPEYDFGDAPDQLYHTTLANNGAYHTLSYVTIGETIDSEDDGIPSINADGDDLSQSDDEDGVIIPDTIFTGTQTEIRVKLVNSGSNDEDVDVALFYNFDNSGSWNSFILMNDIPVPSMNFANVLFEPLFTSNYISDSTYIRIRIFNDETPKDSTNAPLSTGFGGPGEVEDYRIFVVNKPEFDFGDAPEFDDAGNFLFPTTLNHDGARHIENPDVFLGTKIDYEDDGQPSINADGDDLDNLPDEDGVTLLNSIISGGITNIKVRASTRGILNAWMDFNGDNDWDDAGEHIFNMQPVSGGVNNLSFAVPTTDYIGNTYSRFRYSLNGINKYTTEAPDGEVEDYLVQIVDDDRVYDFGDAPDGPYPTLLANDGARHVYNPDVFLGTKIDDEPDGIPDAMANGDNNDNIDDEEGVSFMNSLIPGSSVNLKVHASTWGILNAWMDINIDGDWDDNGEHIFFAKGLAPGDNNISFTLPLDAKPGNTYMRFRFAMNGIDKYTGAAPDGEVEDYFVKIEEEKAIYDFGDCPDDLNSLDYPTLLSSNGARHIVNYKIFLGSSIDTEIDGQPTQHCDGDDFDGNDDEKGVKFLTPIVAGNTGKVEVKASAKGYLNAWIDFNADGDWDDPGERIFHNEMLVPGAQELHYPIPDEIVYSNSYSRFRFTTYENVSYFGVAEDGEVEDYEINLSSMEYFDYGDAPDTPYPTLRANNGAYHKVSPNLYLGDKIDPDADGAPDVNAWGDDTFDSNDDEDGVKFDSQLIPGAVIDVKVQASARGYLNAWIDFDGDGSWADASEHIFIDQILVAGINNLSFVAPLKVTDALTYARFRFSDITGLSFDGPKLVATHVVEIPYGEVEDYKLQFEFDDMEWDYGDCPDTNYQTLKSSNGARHRINPDIFLGMKIDSDSDGQPSADALGDDNFDGNDDEDGVIFLTPWIPGTVAKIEVHASTKGVLNTWVDWNHNHQWDAGAEHVFVNKILNPGANLLSFNVPSTVKPIPVYSRFRFTSYRGVKPYGDAKNGEVEDYIYDIKEVDEEVELDFGDAPDKPYPTLLSHKGAYHVINPDLFLGSRIDAEKDGQPTLLADGDDKTDINDEDGVTFSAPITPGAINQVDVKVSMDGILNAWIDFNNNGTWADAMEQIIIDKPVAAGLNTLSFTAPAGINSDTLYARFRLSQTPKIPFYGPAPEGEVEDLMIDVQRDIPDDQMDFGDLPAQYPTLLADNGARHGNATQLFMGTLRDIENDGMPSPNANSDDLSDSDDEDGVLIGPSFINGHSYYIAIEPHGDGFINGWIDWNSDGNFNGADEHVLVDEPTTFGENLIGYRQVFYLQAPDIITAGDIYVRFRLSGDEGVSYEGFTSTGEVEDYTVSALVENNNIDYGDAPHDPYRTLKEMFSPGHFIDSLFMGEFVDPDEDGQPSVGAIGDDYFDGSDDEDGVEFPYNPQIGMENHLFITSSGYGYVNAWLDLDGEGFIHGSTGKHVIVDEPVEPGINEIWYSIPASSIEDSTYFRFRITHENATAVVGIYVGGEIEDHYVFLEEPEWTFTITEVEEGMNMAGLPVFPDLGFGFDSFFDVFVELDLDGDDDEESLVKSSGSASDNPIILMKNGIGDVYIPEYGINEIGEIDPTEGYQIVSAKTGDFQIKGKLIDPTTPINFGTDEQDMVVVPGRPSLKMPNRRPHDHLLPGDWVLLGFLPNQPIPIKEALEGLDEKILAVRNNMGQTYIPEMGIDEIGTMIPGQSYWVSLNDTGSFSFPAGALNKVSATQDELHFSSVLYTGENTIVVIPTLINPIDEQGNVLSIGDEIAVFNSKGICCGMESWTGENAAITVWGDNVMTEELDGMVPGDTLFFKIWDKSRGYELYADVAFEDQLDIVYEPDVMSVMKSLSGRSITNIDDELVPEQFTVSYNYPNPFNPVTNIEFSLANEASVKLTIYNLLGQEVRQIVNENMSSGYYRVFWDGRNQSGQMVSTGVYLYKIMIMNRTTGEIYLNKTQKMVMVK